jgi:hypothetical protein
MFVAFERGRIARRSVSALPRRGERSEPERGSADTDGAKFGEGSIYVLLRILRYRFAFFHSLSFLRRQEVEASTLAQRVFGGARELVQPSDDS